MFTYWSSNEEKNVFERKQVQSTVCHQDSKYFVEKKLIRFNTNENIYANIFFISTESLPGVLTSRACVAKTIHIKLQF